MLHVSVWEHTAGYVLVCAFHPTSFLPAPFLPFFFSELCWGKAMVVYKMPQQRKKEESERLRGEREIRSSLLILDLKDGKL